MVYIKPNDADTPLISHLNFTYSNLYIENIELGNPLGISDHAMLGFQRLVKEAPKDKDMIFNVEIRYKGEICMELNEFVQNINWNTELNSHSAKHSFKKFVKFTSKKSVDEVLDAEDKKSRKRET